MQSRLAAQLTITLPLASSLVVASLGVVVPFILGFGVSWMLIRELPATLIGMVSPDFNLNYVHMFVGAVLCAPAWALPPGY